MVGTHGMALVTGGGLECALLLHPSADRGLGATPRASLNPHTFLSWSGGLALGQLNSSVSELCLYIRALVQ